jgi:hypothetical protein
MNTDEENKCINAIRQGMKEGIIPMTLTPEMEKLFRMVYQLGYKQSTIDRMEKDLKPTMGYSRVGLNNI